MNFYLEFEGGNIEILKLTRTCHYGILPIRLSGMLAKTS